MTGWHTRINGDTYRLTEHGRLQKEAPMSRTHIDNAQQERQSNAARAVHEELLALARRRMEEHARQQAHEEDQ